MNRHFTPNSGANSGALSAPFVRLRAHISNECGRLYHRLKSALFTPLLTASGAGCFCTGLVLCALLCTGTARGQVTILGNYPVIGSNSATLLSSGGKKAVKFSTKTSLTVHSLKLRLLPSATTIVPVVSIRKNDATGGTNPGSLYGAVFTNPTFSGTTVADYTFTPASATVLDANTSYWIQVENNSSVSFEWQGGSPYVEPTSSGFTTFNLYRFFDAASGSRINYLMV
jgi:hypothetical protein